MTARSLKGCYTNVYQHNGLRKLFFFSEHEILNSSQIRVLNFCRMPDKGPSACHFSISFNMIHLFLTQRFMKAFSAFVPAVIVFISSQGMEEGDHHLHPPPRSAPCEGVYRMICCHFVSSSHPSHPIVSPIPLVTRCHIRPRS